MRDKLKENTYFEPIFTGGCFSVGNTPIFVDSPGGPCCLGSDSLDLTETGDVDDFGGGDRHTEGQKDEDAPGHRQVPLVINKKL
jgi:hypothetical protein